MTCIRNDLKNMEAQVSSKSQIILLKTAKNLFWKHGIRRVTVEEICKEAGVSKMTFYRNFKNKDELVEAIIEQLRSEGQESYDRIMSRKIPFNEKIEQLIQFKYERSKGISKEFLKDIYQSDNPEMLKLLENAQQKAQKTIIKDFKKAQKEGAIRADLKMEFIIYMLNDINNKIMDPQLHKIYPSGEKLIMELTRFFFYGILTK